MDQIARRNANTTYGLLICHQITVAYRLPALHLESKTPDATSQKAIGCPSVNACRVSECPRFTAANNFKIRAQAYTRLTWDWVTHSSSQVTLTAQGPSHKGAHYMH